MADEAEFDVVVVGSGAAGMTAALTAAQGGLRAVVLEKTGAFGGSTARSGGGIWAPGNVVLRKAGVRDSPAEAEAYLASVTGDDAPSTRLVVTDGRVAGVRVLRDGQPTVVTARRGVLIATGGFERNADMRRW